jgi:hypothetical protein
MISETLTAVLKYAKAEDTSYEWKDLAKMLGPLYFYDLRILDVLSILTTVYEEARNEPRFELPGRHRDIYEMITAPVSGTFSIDLWGPKSPETTYTVEQFYSSIIKKMLSDLRFTRQDWFKQLDEV